MEIRGGGKSSGNGSSGTRGRAPALKDRGRQSGENSDHSLPQPKKKKTDGKDLSATEAARQEIKNLLAEPSPNKPSKSPTKPAPEPAKTASTKRQQELEEKRKEVAAAQKIVDDQKEKARLEEENKKLRAQLEKEKAKKDPVPVAELPRQKSASKKVRPSNTARRMR